MLLESVVALVIVGLVAVGELTSVATQLRAADKAKHLTEAEALAEDRLTVVRLLTPNAMASLPDSVEHGRFAAPFDRYSWQTRSTVLSGDEYLYAVTVRVEWAGGAYTLSTRLYRPLPLQTVNAPGGT
jgi:type II secretory pathway pseudopilin PulG